MNRLSDLNLTPDLWDSCRLRNRRRRRRRPGTRRPSWCRSATSLCAPSSRAAGSTSSWGSLSSRCTDGLGGHWMTSEVKCNLKMTSEVKSNLEMCTSTSSTDSSWSLTAMTAIWQVQHDFSSIPRRLSKSLLTFPTSIFDFGTLATTRCRHTGCLNPK